MKMEHAESETNTTTVPKEFRQIVKDFLRDFFTTFPLDTIFFENSSSKRVS